MILEGLSLVLIKAGGELANVAVFDLAQLRKILLIKILHHCSRVSFASLYIISFEEVRASLHSVLLILLQSSISPYTFQLIVFLLPFIVFVSLYSRILRSLF